MAQEYSFDVVSKFDHQELVNAVDQTRREIQTRFDFKGVTAEITLTDKTLTLLAESEYKLKAMFEMLTTRAIKRELSPKIFDAGKLEPAPRGNERQEFKLREGIDDDLARDLAKRIKAVSPKVQARIQGDTLRVSSRDKDTLQTVIAMLRGLDIPTPLQFVNYR
ncbi:MAG: YajQ family cyclic di-GMP-binding protein [Dehalococcoidia bacterium]